MEYNIVMEFGFGVATTIGAARSARHRIQNPTKPYLCGIEASLPQERAAKECSSIASMVGAPHVVKL